MIRRRLVPAAALCFAVVAGLGIRAIFTGVVAKVGGVALWATAVYCLVVLAFPSIRIRWAAAIAAGASLSVELLQLTPGPAWLSAQHVVLRLIFGTTFSPWDLPAYGLGVLLACGVHVALRRHHSA